MGRRLLAAAALLLAFAALAPEALARGGGGCIAWGTPVATPSGPVAIERLREGDLVLTPEGAAIAVLGVLDVEAEEAFSIPSLEAGGPPLVATAEHPVRTAPGRYERAAALGTRVAGPLRARNLVLPPPGAFVAAGRAVHNKGCFVPETPVLLEGGREAPISTVRPGARVVAFDGEGRVVTATVLAVYTVAADLLFEVETEGGRRVRATAEHPFAVPASSGGGFRTVESLGPGDAVLVWGEGAPVADRVRSVARRAGPAPVWNLCTDAPHTFVAGGFAVHNKGGGGCIAWGTPVATPSGPVAIERLREGDLVLTPEGASLPVLGVFDVVAEEAFAVPSPEAGGAPLVATAEHPVRTAPGRYERAADLGARVAGPVRARNLVLPPPAVFVAAGRAVHNKGCFVPETPVLLADGRTVSISSVRPGERVVAFDARGRLWATEVLEVYTLAADHVFEVATEGGRRVRATAEHPFAVPRRAGGGFRTVEALRAGDPVLVWGEGGPVEDRVRSVARRPGATQVWNLAVDAPHTFIAGGFAVHNKGFGGGASYRYRGGGGGTSRPMTAEETRWFCTVFGILVFIFILVFVFQKKLSRTPREEQDLDFCFSAAQVAPKVTKTCVLLERLAQNDLDVKPDALERVARAAFTTLQECWEARDYSRMAPLVMPDLRAQHEAQIASMKRNHEINRIRGVMVKNVWLVHLRYAEQKWRRQFTALIDASAIDWYEDDRTGRFLRGDRTSASFQEFWTFQMTSAGEWLLREVEQSRESNALREENFVEFLTKDKLASAYGEKLAPQAGPAGPWAEAAQLDKGTKIHRLLNFLAETDRAWSEEAILERARTVAITHHAALEAAATEPLQGLATREFIEEQERIVKRDLAQAVRVEFRNLCVRKVELVLVRNRADDARDEVYARVSLHAQRIRTREGRVVSQDPHVMPAEGIYRLVREGGAPEWKLAEVLPARQAGSLLAAENVDEDSTPDRLQWYYTQARTVGGESG